MKRISKAIAAGISAGLGAAFVYLQSHSFDLSAETIGGMAGAFVSVGVVAGIATYRAPANAPQPSPYR